MKTHGWFRAVPPLLVGALLLVGSGAAAQEGTDPRWLPWFGCWESESAAQGSMLCIVPMPSDAGVEMVSVEGGQVVSREWVRADGEQRESSREGCRGWERARFSGDSRRIYLNADHLCEGVVQQETSGMLALVSATEWIDVRAISVGDEAMTGVSRYRLAPSDVAEAAGFGNVAADRAMSVRAARVAAAARLGPSDVIDASDNVGDEVVRAWIAERREPFRIDAEQLVRMADAGVSPSVIDVVVAVSYPRRFQIGEGAQVAVVEREVNEDARARQLPTGMRRGRFWDPFYGYSRYYDPYYRDAYRYGYGSGYGYGYGYGYPGDFRPTVVIVQPRVETPSRAVNGRGYTQSRGSSGSSSSAPARAPSSGSSGSSGSSTSTEDPPSSSGSSGGSTSTGRTAQPRPPGQ